MTASSRRIALALVGAALAAGACAGGNVQPGHGFRVIERDGVPVAVSSATPRYAGELFRYERILTLRPEPGNDASLLYRPYTFTLAADGTYYVADRGNHRIAVFDGAGKFVRSFGQEGEGPGELSAPLIVEVAGDIVTVIGRRTSYFRSDGTFLELLSHPGGRARRLADGSIYVEDTTRSTRDEVAYFGARARVFGDGGEAVSSIETAQRPGSGMIKYLGDPTVALTEAGEIFATSGAEPVLRWYGLDGHLLREARIELPPEPVTEADRAAVDELWDRLIAAARAGNQRIPVEGLEELKRGSEYPPTKAYWERPILDGGWVWLPAAIADTGLGGGGEAPVEARRWFRIVDPTGRFVGTTEWPAEAVVFNGAQIVRGHLLTMVWDEQAGDVVPTVYRIVAAVNGLVYP